MAPTVRPLAMIAGVAGLAAVAATMLVMGSRERRHRASLADVRPAPAVERIVSVPAPSAEVQPPPPPVPTPQVAPTPIAPPPVVVAKSAPIKKRTETPPRPVAKREASNSANRRDLDNEVLTQYQRVAARSTSCQQKRGVAATSELWQEFRGLAIQPALATPQSRAAAAAVLRDLQNKIERQQGVSVQTRACRTRLQMDAVDRSP